MWKLFGLVACLLQVTILVCGENTGYYSVIGPGVIRSNSDYHVSVTIHESTAPSSVKVEIIGPKYKESKTVEVKPLSTETVKFKIPELEEGNYNLTAEGLTGVIFKNTTTLNLEHKYYSVYIQTDKATYKPGDLVRFRVLVLDANTRPLDVKKDIDIIITDSAQNRIKQFKRITLTKGVYTGELQLSTFPVLGNWQIDVSVGGENTEKSFEVAKYVLPKFDVQIDTPKDITIQDNKIRATIRSKYTYGKPVKGIATISVKPQYKIYNLEKQPFAEKTISIDGKAKVEFDLGIPTSQDYYQPPLIVTAIVEEELTGLKQNTTTTVTVHRERFKINALPNNPTLFTPGEKMNIGISVKLYDDTPVQDSKNPVFLEIEKPRYTYFSQPLKEGEEPEKNEKIESRLDDNGIAKFEFTIPETANISFYSLKVHFIGETNYLGSISKREAKVGDFFTVEVLTEKPKLSNDVTVKVSSNKDLPNFFYQIIGRGNIVQQGKVEVGEKENTKEFSFKPSFEMVPRAQIFVYFVRDGEMIFEETSTNFDNELENFINIDIPTQAKPGEDVNIKVSTNPDSFVGLMGVDQSVLLLKSGNDISKDTVFSDLSNYNTRTPWMRGWGRYPGQQAGLVTMTNAHYPYDETPRPLPQNSPVEVYRVADDATMKIYIRKKFPETWIWHSTEKLIKLNTRRRYPIFLRPYPVMEATFTNRMQATATSYAFLRSPSAHSAAPVSITPVPLVTRKLFPETWIWFTEEPSNENGNGEFTIHNKVPDTITSWVLTGFSLNSKTGLGLTNSPQKLKVFQPFFVSTNLPYSVKRGEVIAVPVIVFNYLEKDLEAEIVMDNTDKDYEFTEATNEVEEKSIDEVLRTKRLTIPANSGKSVSFMIRPKKVGHLTVKVKATTPIAGDAIEQILPVEPEGVTQYVNNAIFINLKEKNEQNEKVKIDIPENAVPGSQYIEVSVVGDLLGPTIKNLDKLVRMPYGCGEQNMVNFVPNILVLKYLNNIGQLNPTIETKAKRFLEVGYQKELTYKHDDGSYSAFGKSDGNGSTWLTAYVCRSFHQAAPYTEIDPKVIDEGLKFLANQQDEDGRFPEYGKVIDKAHSGDSDNGISLTAFVLLAFLENKESRPKYEDNIQKAIKFLNEHLDKTDDVYALAISAYALKLAQVEKSDKIIAQLNSVAKTEGDRKWWSKPIKENKEKDVFWYHKPRSADVEMTAYALLGFLEGSSSEETLPILKWLISQRNKEGGFASTQDTVVGLQALIKFSEKFSSGKSGKIEVGFTDDKGTNDKINVDSENSLVLQSHVLPSDATEVNLNAKGEGSCLAQVSYKYNVATKSNSPRFNVKTKVKDSLADQLKLDVCVSYIPIDDDVKSNMAVVEINLPSGYTASESDGSLDELKNTRNVQRIETKNKESVIVVYYDNIDANEICAPVEATKTSAVAKQKPAAVEAYDYYSNVNRGIDYYEVKSSLCDICSGDDCGTGCKKPENP